MAENTHLTMKHWKCFYVKLAAGWRFGFGDICGAHNYKTQCIGGLCP